MRQIAPYLSVVVPCMNEEETIPELARRLSAAIAPWADRWGRRPLILACLALSGLGMLASALSQAIDSVIFITLAFYGQFEITNLLIGQIIAKVVLSLVLVPFLITGGVAFARWLDRR